MICRNIADLTTVQSKYQGVEKYSLAEEEKYFVKLEGSELIANRCKLWTDGSELEANFLIYIYSY